MDIFQRMAKAVQQKAIDVRQDDDTYEFRCEVQPTTADIENQSHFEIAYKPPIPTEEGTTFKGQLIYMTMGTEEKWRKDQVFYMHKFSKLFYKPMNIQILSTAPTGELLKSLKIANPDYDSFEDDGGTGVFVTFERNEGADESGRESEVVDDVQTFGAFFFNMVWDFELEILDNEHYKDLLNS